jgi:YHS domain-containing protein
VHARLRAEGLSGPELMDSTHAASEELRALMEPTILYFHNKALAQSLEHDVALHAAEESGLLPPSDVTGQLDASVVFVDLASFTSLTESMGDVTATELLSRFSQLVRRAVNHCEGRVVKQIGDAFMLVFPDPTSAFRESGTPPPDTELVPLGSFKLRGLSEAVELFELRSGHRTAVEKAVDPVCGMQLAPNEVVGRVAVGGGERVFCSLACLNQFSDDPDRYAP